MKKSFLAIAIFVFLVFFSPTTQAQEFDYEKAYNDYLYNFNLYRQAHLEYVSARSEYYAYQTLESETKALEKTRSLLHARNQTLVSYLTALRMRLVETTKLTNYEQNLRFIYLDNQITFLKINDQKLPSPGSLDDLLAVSSEVEKKYPEAEVLAYQTLGVLNSGQVEDLTSRLEEEVKKLEKKINEMRNSGEDTTTIERWLLNVKEKISLAKQKREEGRNIMNGLASKEKDKKGQWLSSQRKFEEANQYLKEAISYTKEIIKRLKYE